MYSFIMIERTFLLICLCHVVLLTATQINHAIERDYVIIDVPTQNSEKSEVAVPLSEFDVVDPFDSSVKIQGNHVIQKRCIGLSTLLLWPYYYSFYRRPPIYYYYYTYYYYDDYYPFALNRGYRSRRRPRVRTPANKEPLRRRQQTNRKQPRVIVNRQPQARSHPQTESTQGEHLRSLPLERSPLSALETGTGRTYALSPPTPQESQQRILVHKRKPR